MTAPWDPIPQPVVTGWWVRKERIGAGQGGYDFAGAVTGKKTQKGTASGAYDFAGSGTGLRLEHYSDNFNRTDNTSVVGTGWTTRFGTCGINTNAFYSNATNYCGASYDSPLSRDDMAVTITVGTLQSTGGDVVGCFLGANTSGAGGMWLELANGGYLARIYSTASWASSFVERFTSDNSESFTTGDQIRFFRVGTQYTAQKNGNNIAGLTAVDDYGAYGVRDSSHRICGVFGWRSAGGSYRRIDAWDAIDIAA